MADLTPRGSNAVRLQSAWRFKPANVEADQRRASQRQQKVLDSAALKVQNLLRKRHARKMWDTALQVSAQHKAARTLQRAWRRRVWMQVMGNRLVKRRKLFSALDEHDRQVAMEKADLEWRTPNASTPIGSRARTAVKETPPHGVAPGPAPASPAARSPTKRGSVSKVTAADTAFVGAMVEGAMSTAAGRVAANLQPTWSTAVLGEVFFTDDGRLHVIDLPDDSGKRGFFAGLWAGLLASCGAHKSHLGSGARCQAAGRIISERLRREARVHPDADAEVHPSLTTSPTRSRITVEVDASVPPAAGREQQYSLAGLNPPSGEMSLAAKAELLKAQLGLSGTMAAVADGAVRELDLKLPEDATIARKLDAAVAAVQV